MMVSILSDFLDKVAHEIIKFLPFVSRRKCSRKYIKRRYNFKRR